MHFEIIGAIRAIQRIAVGTSLRERNRLRKFHGPGRWRKLKGIASIRFFDGKMVTAELHWYEAHGIGRREMKVKRIIG